MNEGEPLISAEESVVVLGVPLLSLFLVEVVHVELNGGRSTCLWKEVRLECLK